MNIPTILFEPFAKIARLSKDALVTEKIDGSNASIYIDDAGEIFAASRTRWITPDDDNFGFATWVEAHKEELLSLGLGLHRGEWWGKKIQRGYGLKEKRFSLFNVERWCLSGTAPKQIACGDPRIVKFQEALPSCVGLVPELYRGPFTTESVDQCLEILKTGGSYAVPGWMTPEGVVVYHLGAGMAFKKTILNDSTGKSHHESLPQPARSG